MNKTFVIGNGESRANFNLNSLHPYGIIIGCNAIYRDFAPDILIAVDPKMIKEITDSGYTGTVNFSNPRGWSAGPTAVSLAACLSGDIYLLGFDLYGINGKHNNIYKGTENYKAADNQETYYGNWVKQLAIVFKEHPEKNFCRVGREEDPVPKEWAGLRNINFISYNEMLEILSGN